MPTTETVSVVNSDPSNVRWIEIADETCSFVQFIAVPGAQNIHIGDDEPELTDPNYQLTSGDRVLIKNANAKIWLMFSPSHTMSVVRGDAEITFA